MRHGFTWDESKADSNLGDHGVSFEEAIEVFDDDNALESLDETHSDHEPRYIRIGLSYRRLLMVVFTEVHEDTIRIISARKANAKEKALYEEK